MNSTEKKLLLFTVSIFVVTITLWAIIITGDFITTVENLSTPDTPEVNSISDLTKFSEYESNIFISILIKFFSGLLRAFTGKTVVETLTNIQNGLILFLIPLTLFLAIINYLAYKEL
jgi:hypothetical protein